MVISYPQILALNCLSCLIYRSLSAVIEVTASLFTYKHRKLTFSVGDSYREHVNFELKGAKKKTNLHIKWILINILTTDRELLTRFMWCFVLNYLPSQLILKYCRPFQSHMPQRFFVGMLTIYFLRSLERILWKYGPMPTDSWKSATNDLHSSPSWK